MNADRAKTRISYIIAVLLFVNLLQDVLPSRPILAGSENTNVGRHQITSRAALYTGCTRC